jgi:hypothetical protein
MDETDRDIERLERRGKVARAIGIGVAIAASLSLISWGGTCVYGFVRDMRESDAERRASSQTATAEQIAAVDAAADALEAGAAATIETWRAGMSRAAQVVPRPDLGRCPFQLPVRQPYDASRGGSFNNLDSFSAIVFPGSQGFPHAIAVNDLPPVPPGVETSRSRATRLRERIREPGRVESFADIVAAARGLSRRLTYDVVLFASELERPRAAPDGRTFAPGRVRGVAVLYDYSAGSIACAGAVEARNTSTSVEYASQALFETSTLQEQIDAEFASEVERAIARAVQWRAGERIADADAGAAGDASGTPSSAP